MRGFFPERFTPDEGLKIIGAPAAGALGPDIRLLVWNIYKGRVKTWQEDFGKLSRDFDLILLQESVLNTKYDAIFQAEGVEWVMALGHRNIRTQAVTGVKTGSICASTVQRSFVAPSLEPLFKTPKTMLATTYPLAGHDTPLLVLNIHAINFVTATKHNLQLAQIAEAIDNFAGPVILAGDFNTWSAMRFRNLREISAKLGLTEVSFDRKGRLQHFNQHLDHIFYRGLALDRAEILTKIESSDHFPLTAKFRVL